MPRSRDDDAAGDLVLVAADAPGGEGNGWAEACTISLSDKDHDLEPPGTPPRNCSLESNLESDCLSARRALDAFAAAASGWAQVLSPRATIGVSTPDRPPPGDAVALSQPVRRMWLDDVSP